MAGPTRHHLPTVIQSQLQQHRERSLKVRKSCLTCNEVRNVEWKWKERDDGTGLAAAKRQVVSLSLPRRDRSPGNLTWCPGPRPAREVSLLPFIAKFTSPITARSARQHRELFAAGPVRLRCAFADDQHDNERGDEVHRTFGFHFDAPLVHLIS